MWVFFLLFSISIKPFNYFSKSLKNIHVTDLYFQSIKGQTIDTNIVIVNVENISRKDLAALISLVADKEPAIIGIDIIFDKNTETEGDSILYETLFQLKDKVVLAAFYDPVIGSYSEEYQLFDNLFKGHTNLNAGENRTNVVREFVPKYGNQEEIKYESFSSTIVKLYEESTYEKLTSRNKELEIINFIGNAHSFKIYSSTEILQERVDFTGLQNKIVLLGFMGSQSTAYQLDDLKDLFYTPLNSNIWGKSLPDMYGVIVHANIIHMLLAGDYMNSWSGLSFFLFLFMVLYMHVLPFIYFFVEKHLWYHVFAKIFQFFSLVLLVLLSIYCFSVNVYLPEFKYLLLCIFLSVDALYLYEAIAVILYNKKGIKSIFIHG
jgi:CHASE2 domain-containing sensor protein